MNHNIVNETNGRAPVEAGVITKLGIDVHARQITVCRQIGDRTAAAGAEFCEGAAVGVSEAATR